MYPRHTRAHIHAHTHTQRTLARLVTQPATDKVLPSTAPTYRTRIRYKSRQTYHLFPFGWQRQKVPSAAHTQHSPGSQAHVHSWIPCLDPSHSNVPHWSLIHRLVQLGVHWKHPALTHSSHRHPTLMGPPRHQYGLSARLIPQPGPKVPCFSARQT